MTDFFAENKLFVVNAALLAGLIAGAYAMQNSGNDAASAVVSEAVSDTAPSTTTTADVVPVQIKPSVRIIDDDEDDD